MLFKNLYHYGLAIPEIHFIDTMDLLRSKKLECGLGLKESCQYFNIVLEQHHKALMDTKAAHDLFKVLAKDIKDLPLFIHRYTPGERCIGYDRQLFRNNKNYTREQSTKPASQSTRKVQEMKGLLSSITYDKRIDDKELYRLRDWILSHDGLAGNYPFDAMLKTVTKIMADGKMDGVEEKELLDLIDTFLNPTAGPVKKPDDGFSFHQQVVCLTGDFYYGSKNEVKETIERQGGITANNVDNSTTMVLVGALGSKRWSYGNYGSKVKKAMDLKAKGREIAIISENDIRLGDDN